MPFEAAPYMARKERVLAKMRAAVGVMTKAAAAQLAVEAQDLAKAIADATPVRTGALKSTVKAVRTSETDWVVQAGGAATTKKVRAGVKDGDFAKARVTGGSKGEFDYARGVEFGHRDGDGKHVPAEPFFFSTYRARRAGIRRRVVAKAKQAAADVDVS